MGRFAQIGHRITGHRINGHHRRKRSHHLGYDDVASEGPSRAAQVEVLTDEKGNCCISHAFRDAACALGERPIRQRPIRTGPYTPKTNGKAERFIKTLQKK